MRGGKHTSVTAPRIESIGFLFAALVASALCISCSALKPRPEQTRFLLLAPENTSGGQGPAGNTITDGLPPIIGLGPVQLPPYLDRQELVVRTSPTGFELSDRDRWAEPLTDNFRRVLGSNLQTQLGSADIVQYPWYAYTKLDYIIRVQVERFDVDTANMATLVARWELRKAKPDQGLDTRESQFSHTASSSSGEAVAAALSENVADLAQQIALAVEEAQQQRFAGGRAEKLRPGS
jgi:uncharacterized protein